MYMYVYIHVNIVYIFMLFVKSQFWLLKSIFIPHYCWLYIRLNSQCTTSYPNQRLVEPSLKSYYQWRATDRQSTKSCKHISTFHSIQLNHHFVTTNQWTKPPPAGAPGKPCPARRARAARRACQCRCHSPNCRRCQRQ